MPGTSAFRGATSALRGRCNGVQRRKGSSAAAGTPQPTQVAQPASRGQLGIWGSPAPSASTTTTTVPIPVSAAIVSGPPGPITGIATANTIRSTDRTESTARCRSFTDMGLGGIDSRWSLFISASRPVAPPFTSRIVSNGSRAKRKAFIDGPPVMAIIRRMTHGGPFLSRVLAALLLVPLSLGALQCAVAADEDSASPPACCARADAGGDTLDPGIDTDAAGGASWCPGICAGTALPSIAADSISTGAAPYLGRPADWIAGRSLAPDPFPPKSVYTI